MAGFVKCDLPSEFKIRTYGENQKLITSFVESGYKCAKVVDFVGNIECLSGRLTTCAKKT